VRRLSIQGEFEAVVGSDLRRSAIPDHMALVRDDMADQRREYWFVAVFLGLFLLFNICTATAYPFPDIDECMIAEPAINFIHGKGFGVRFSEILAMYSFLLVPWIKLFGASLRSLRSANIICATTALLVLWSAVKRLALIPQAIWRLVLLCVLAAEFGMIFAYRTGRYDGFGCLLMSVVILAMSIPSKRERLSALFFVCLFLPWAGPQYLVALFAAGVVLCILFQLRYWMEIAASFLASVLGAIGFVWGVYISGRLRDYRDFLSIQQRGGTFFSELVKHGRLVHHNFLPKDFSLPFLIAGALIMFVSLRKRRSTLQYSAVCFGMLYCALLSAILISIAKFPTYYSYLIAIPISVAVISALAVSEFGRAKLVTAALCLVSALAGAGANAVAYASDARDHDYRLIEGFVAESVRGTDVAYVDAQVYIPARRLAQDAYFPNPDLQIISKMSQKQRDSITLLVIQPSWIRDTTQLLGGNWQETGQELRPSAHSVFGANSAGFISWTLRDLRVLRRTSYPAPQITAALADARHTNRSGNVTATSSREEF
jgi:hypothetical protein